MTTFPERFLLIMLFYCAVEFGFFISANGCFWKQWIHKPQNVQVTIVVFNDKVRCVHFSFPQWM